MTAGGNTMTTTAETGPAPQSGAQGARRARTETERLVLENLPLVGYLVSDVCARATHLSRDDLASAGALALVQAARAFDATRGIPFGAFARQRIMGAFADEMRSSDWASRGARRRMRDTLAVQDALTMQLGRVPSVDEVAAALGVDRAAASAALSDAGRTVGALDEMVEATLEATTALPEDSVMAQERERFLKQAVDALPERMRYIVDQLYFEGRSVKDVADELGVTHSAVSQQRTAAMALLREGIAVHYEGQDRADAAGASATARAASYLARLAELSLAATARPVLVDGRASPGSGEAPARAG
jgi:RNA polymerase sigma factor FliA